MKNTEPTFNPAEILGDKEITEKSKLEDLILYSIVKKSPNNTGVSVGVIKKYLDEVFKRKITEKSNKNINLELVKLIDAGKLLNTSGKRGASGSFIINPDFADFDSRSQFAGKDLDPIDTFIEDIITERCYDGKPYEKVKTKTELKLEKEMEEKRAKKDSLYNKVLPMYEQMLGGEIFNKNRNRKWNGTFFDTKVEQTDFFECICGSDLDAEDDKKYRVQCNECGIYQHAECVR